MVERKEWTKPVVRKIVAGSAEAKGANAKDGQSNNGRS